MTPAPHAPRVYPDPSLLTHPNIPKPLHGISPRVVLGKEWWDKTRQWAYRMAEYHCQACGIPKENALYHQWLEAHELYEYRWAEGRLIFRSVVALCHSCHNFIHDGRMRQLVRAGEMSADKMKDIMEHGTTLLKKHDLKRKAAPMIILPDWTEWRMHIRGTDYGPSSASFSDWEQGAWRNWKP